MVEIGASGVPPIGMSWSAAVDVRCNGEVADIEGRCWGTDQYVPSLGYPPPNPFWIMSSPQNSLRRSRKRPGRTPFLVNICEADAAAGVPQQYRSSSRRCGGHGLARLRRNQ